MLPTSKTARTYQRKAPAAGVRRTAPSAPSGPDDALRPIGPERLRALREAIRNGTYPTEADVLGGLERLLDLD